MICIALTTVPRPFPRREALKFIAVDAGLRRFVCWRGASRSPAKAVFLFAGNGTRTSLRTDAHGLLELPRGAKGPVLLAATLLHAPRLASDAFDSDFAPVLFEPR